MRVPVNSVVNSVVRPGPYTPRPAGPGPGCPDPPPSMSSSLDMGCAFAHNSFPLDNGAKLHGVVHVVHPRGVAGVQQRGAHHPPRLAPMRGGRVRRSRTEELAILGADTAISMRRVPAARRPPLKLSWAPPWVTSGRWSFACHVLDRGCSLPPLAVSVVRPRGSTYETPGLKATGSLVFEAFFSMYRRMVLAIGLATVGADAYNHGHRALAPGAKYPSYVVTQQPHE